MGLSVLQVAVGGFDDNFSYIVYDEATKNAAVVDPSGELELLLEAIDERDLDIVGVLITHTHHDHIEKLDELLRSYTVPVYVHEEGRHSVVSQGPIHSVHEGDTIELGESILRVLYTPGHIDDAVCYFIAAEHAEDGVPKLISGDTLFVEGCGRTNQNDVRALYDSLQQLKKLPDTTLVYPGHDYGSKPHSTLRWEMRHNKYLLAKDFKEFEKIRLG